MFPSEVDCRTLKKDDGFLSDQQSSNLTHVEDQSHSGNPPKKTTGGVTVPPQKDIKYESMGERKPDVETHENVPITQASKAEYANNESQLALRIKQELRKTGYCGFAQAAIELTVDPAGNVVGNRIMYSNNDKVSSALPSILTAMKFTAQPSIRANYYTIVQFKTEIVCSGKGSVDIQKMPNVIQNPK